MLGGACHMCCMRATAVFCLGCLVNCVGVCFSSAWFEGERGFT